MPLTTISYNPSVTGAQIVSEIQSQMAGQQMTLGNAQTMSIQIWNIIISKIYTDFSSVLSNAIKTFINLGQSQFMPVGPMPITVTSVELSQFNSLSMPTASALVSDLQSSGLGGQPASQQGIQVWKKVFHYIFEDMKNVISNAVTTACNGMITMVSPGAIAPPHTGTIGLVPASITNPFVNSVLLAQMISYYNDATALSLAGEIVTASPALGQTPGAIWDLFINKLQTGVNTKITKHIRTFLTADQHITIPLGTPGQFWLPPFVLPTSGVVYGIIF